VSREIHAQAQSKFLAAIDHYASISAELGERFYAEIERLTQEVCAAPRRFRQYDPPARRHLSRDFPFAWFTWNKLTTSGLSQSCR